MQWDRLAFPLTYCMGTRYMGFRSPCNNTTRAIQAPKCGICVSGPVLHTGQITCKTEPPASRSLQQGRACGMGWPITRQSAKGSNPQKSAVGFRGGVRVRESISGEVVISRKTSLSNHSPGWKTTCMGGITQKADCKDAAARCSYDKVAEMATSPRGRRETFTPFQLAIPSHPPTSPGVFTPFFERTPRHTGRWTLGMIHTCFALLVGMYVTHSHFRGWRSWKSSVWKAFSTKKQLPWMKKGWLPNIHTGSPRSLLPWTDRKRRKRGLRLMMG